MNDMLSASPGCAPEAASNACASRGQCRKNGSTVVLSVALLLLLAGPTISCACSAELESRETVFKKRKASVVRIETAFPDNPGKAMGAGLIVSKTGYVVTNRHVIDAEGDRRVIFFDGRSYPFRVVVGVRDLDLALVKIDSSKTFSPLPLDLDGEAKLGDPVFAIGNPGGNGLTISAGKVIGIGTYWTWGGPYSDRMIAFNAPIHGGNSGGPLVNDKGDAVGVVFCTAEGVQNRGFAVPIDGALTYLRTTLVDDGRLFFELGMDVPVAGDGTVASVVEGGPADRAGIKAGDRITAVEGGPVNCGFDIDVALVDRNDGDSVRIKLRRGGKPFKTTLTLGRIKARPAATVASAKRGLKVEYYEGDWDRLPDFDRLEPATTGVVDSVGVESHKGKDHFALRFTGYVKVPAEGDYRFYISSDDGCRVRIGDEVVAVHNGLHAATLRRGRRLQLAAGLHPITVTYFEKANEEALKLMWQSSGQEPRQIPPSAFFHAAEPVR